MDKKGKFVVKEFGRGKQSESAVSEVVATVLVIALVVSTMGLVGVMVTQNVIPGKIPVMSFEACIQGAHTLNMYHTGGDNLNPSEGVSNFYVNLLDGDKKIIQVIKLMPWLHDTWKTGTVLTIGTEEHPIIGATSQYVQIVSKNGGEENLIGWAQLNPCTGSFTPGPGPGCLGRTSAIFSVDTITGASPTRTFTDQSTYDTPEYPITSVEWNFGDGSPPEIIAAGDDITHTFSSNGVYQVRLRAINDCGWDETVRPISVGSGSCPPVRAGFTTDPNPPMITGQGVTGLDVSFIDASSPLDNITRWEWDFGDGQTFIGQNPSTHSYSRGIYWPTLTVFNGCGEWDSHQVQVSVTTDTDCSISPSFRATPSEGPTPLSVSFEDFSSTSRGWINRWEWDFGDGSEPYITSEFDNRNPPDHEYTNAGSEPRVYTVTLTVSNTCGAEGTTYQDITVWPPCEPVVADFSWDPPTSFDPYVVQFHSPLQNCGSQDCEYNIVRWEWEFEDGGPNETVREPLREFPGDEFDPTGTYVTLTVWNDDFCQSSHSIRKELTFDCETLHPSFDRDPPSGPPGIEVTFTDTTPIEELDNIVKWRWIFGDTTSPYESTDKDNHNPPPHIYADPVPRIYNAVLQVQNACGQWFSTSRQIEVTDDASISGYLWDDQNLNGIEDSGEPRLDGWTVNLERREGTNWVLQGSTQTDPSGNYEFTPTVGTAVYRVTINYPVGQTWKTTYSYRSNAEQVSGLLSIGADRIITGVNFGNVRWKTSSLIIPGSFNLYSQSGNFQRTFYYTELWNTAARYFEFTTSRDPSILKSFLNPISSSSGTFTIPSFSNWGDSSFIIYPREYNTYLKGSGGAHYLKIWDWDGHEYLGIPFTVPDNTMISASQLLLKYYWDPVVYFKFDKPVNNEIVPYTNSYRVEVHYQGPREDQSQCFLISPVSSEEQLIYNSSIGEYVKNINVTPWEGETRQFTARMRLTNGTNAYTHVTATIGWEPLIVTVEDVESEVIKPQIRGITTVTGTVTGKWRDNTNVWLVVNGKETYPMTLVSESGTTSTFTSSFDPEPYAGKEIPLIIRAYPQPDRGDMVESAAYMVTVVSKLPLVADFIADPSEGPAPLWVAFTDTSVGGPNWWLWDFDEGNTSSVQHPIKAFAEPGNYSVTLEVRNITGDSSTISRWVNLTGEWRKVEVNTDRPSYLKAGGEIRWIAAEDNSNITVNNTAFPIMAGDTVKIVLNSDQMSSDDIRIDIGGGITTCRFSDVSLFLNGQLIDTGPSTAIEMSDFYNLHSTLQLVCVPTAGKFAMIRWNNEDWINVGRNRELIVYDLMPDWNNMMTLYLTEGFTTFDGWASSYIIH